jgi:hypothetical protein
MFYTIVRPEISIEHPDKIRPGLCVDPGATKAVFSRVIWRGGGRIAPPFFQGRMENGPTELMALQGTLCEVVAVRYRHRISHSFAQHMERCKVAVAQKLSWDRIMDDYF